MGRDDNKPIGKRATGGAMAAPAFAYYYKKLLKLYPKTKRTFDIPQGVFRGKYEKKTELYTKNSPLPSVEKPIDPYERYLNEDNETISVERDTGLTETITIEDDLDEGKGDALHPKRNVPIRPVSEDSGELF